MNETMADKVRRALAEHGPCPMKYIVDAIGCSPLSARNAMVGLRKQGQAELVGKIGSVGVWETLDPNAVKNSNILSVAVSRRSPLELAWAGQQ